MAHEMSSLIYRNSCSGSFHSNKCLEGSAQEAGRHTPTSSINRLTPNDPYMGRRTANLQNVAFYIFIQQI